MPEPAAPARVRSLLSTLPAPASKDERFGRVIRLVVATVSSLVAAGVMRSWDDHPPLALWVPTGLLALSALLAHHGAVGSQLIARSAWWANLVLGTLISVVGGSRNEEWLGLALALGSGAALLAMGRMGLGEDGRSAFKPVAFRTTLTLGMIMAVADAQGLLLFGALQLEEHRAHHEQGVLLLGSAAFIMLAIAGLYRLRVWGLLLSSLGAIGVIALAASDAYGLKGPIANALIVTSLVQLFLPTPIFIAIARRRAPAPGPASSSRLARLGPAILVALMMASSTWMVCVVGHGLR